MSEKAENSNSDAVRGREFAGSFLDWRTDSLSHGFDSGTLPLKSSTFTLGGIVRGTCFPRSLPFLLSVKEGQTIRGDWDDGVCSDEDVATDVGECAVAAQGRHPRNNRCCRNFLASLLRHPVSNLLFSSILTDA